jgi:hypothetical protein
MSSVSNPSGTLTDAQILQLSNVLIGEVPAGVINGVNKVFTVVNSYQTDSTRLDLNGIIQINPDEYTESADKEITFVNPPKPGDALFIQYKLEPV